MINDSILFNIDCAVTCNWVEVAATAILGTYGVGVPTLGKEPHRLISWFSSWVKSFKKLSPNITDSVAFLSPNNTLGELTIKLLVSMLTDSFEFKFMVLYELSNIESFFELNNNLPELNII